MKNKIAPITNLEFFLGEKGVHVHESFLHNLYAQRGVEWDRYLNDLMVALGWSSTPELVVFWGDLDAEFCHARNLHEESPRQSIATNYLKPFGDGDYPCESGSVAHE